MSRHSDLYTEEYKGYTIRILHDQDCSSPRENDNLATIATWHKRYQLGDVQPSEEPSEYIAGLPKGSIVLPVLMYEHSGIALSTSAGSYPFTDPWDSGQVGYIHVSRDRVLKEWSAKRLTAKLRAKVLDVLKSEIKEYGAYVNGECYGYVIEDVDGDQIDSCWGFIGYEYVQQEARSQADWYAAERDKRNAEEREARDDS